MDYKKDENNIYLPKAKPEVLTIPKYKFFAIDGKGDPNGEDFEQNVEALYSLAYAVKMSKSRPEGYFEYKVYPLEGVWTSETEDISDKSKFIYTIMIRQPDFVGKAYAEKIIEEVKKRKKNPKLECAKFFEYEEGISVQMMHIGSYDSEPASFEIIHNFMKENKLSRKDAAYHREIYLSDPRKTPAEKHKTVIRVQVKNI